MINNTNFLKLYSDKPSENNNNNSTMLASNYTTGAAALRAATDPNKPAPWSSNLPLLTVTIPKTGGDGNSVLAAVDASSLRVVKNRNGHFLVVFLSPSCKLRTYGVDVGMELLSIDNISCTAMADEAAFLDVLHSQGDSSDNNFNSSSSSLAFDGTEAVETPSKKKPKPLGLTTILAYPSPVASKQYIPPPGTYVTAVIEKEVQTTSVGLLVAQHAADGSSANEKGGTIINNGTVTRNRKDNEEEVTTEYGKVMIQSIAPDALASGTALRAGMQLISINNTLCVNKRESAHMLRSLTGRITLLAQIPNEHVKTPTSYHVTATVEVLATDKGGDDDNKTEEPKGALGLTLSDTKADTEEKTGVFVAKIDPNGTFAESKLRPGMEILRINNIECHDDLALAEALLGNAANQQRRSLVTVLAKQACQSVPPGTLVTATAIKTNAESKLGIMVGMDHNTMPVLQFVREDGLMAKSCDRSVMLEPGMILHKINNVPTKGLKTKEQVSELLQTRATPQGVITLLLEAPTTSLAGGTSATPAMILESLKTITMIQKVPRQSIGWTLGLPAQQQGRIVVTDVEDGGLAATAGVRKGMVLFKIDNTTLECCYQWIADADEVVSKLVHDRPLGAPITLLVEEETPTTLVKPVMVGTIVKETKESKVGIRLRQHKGDVAIISIAEGSASAATELMGGMLIQSINNVSCTGKSPEEVAQMLADGEGAIPMMAKIPDCPLSEATVASFVTTSVSKEAREKDDARDRCFTYEEGKVWVSEAGVNGLFQSSPLRIGMEILSLNNIPCEILTPDGIKTMLKKSEDEYITVLAKHPDLPVGLLMTDILRKKDPADKFGLDCTASKGWRSKVVISNIKDGSLASTSRLLEGMEVLMVNNSDCSRLDAQGAADTLGKQAATGNVTYVAGVSSKDVPLYTRTFVTATLDPGDRPIGITVDRNHYGKNVVAAIEDGSLASETELRVGMEILAVNNVSCQHRKSLDVLSLLSITPPSEKDQESSASSSMVILAEQPAIPQGKIVTGSMVKTSAEMKVGVTMREVDGRVIIKDVNPESLVAATDLGVGMWIRAINNKDCTKSGSKEVADMLKAQVSVITILAETTNITFEVPTPAPAPDSNGETAEAGSPADSSDETAEGTAAVSESGDETAAASGESGEDGTTASEADSGEDSTTAGSF